MKSKGISPDFPLKSNYIEILSSRVHYIDKAKVILFCSSMAILLMWSGLFKAIIKK